VTSKLRTAELEFEKEQYKGRVARLNKTIHRLGGDSLEVAKSSTQMEVRLAQALQQVAALTQQNEALQLDVSSMIDLKLQLAEAQAAARAE